MAVTLPTPPDPAALLAGARRELARLPAILGAMLSEVEDFGARVRAILDGAERFARIDPERWAVERRYHEAEEPRRLARLIEHPRLGRMPGLDLLAAWVTHDRLHLAQLAVPTPPGTVSRRRRGRDPVSCRITPRGG